MERPGNDWGAVGPQYGFRVFTFSAVASPEVIDFVREYRARCAAYAFCRSRGLCRPFSKYVYVPAVATVYKHVLNQSNSVLKASHIWPVLPVKFYLPEGDVYGNTAAPVVVDLAKGEVRIPFLKVRVGVRGNAVEKLLGLLGDDVRPRFAAQLVLMEDGMGREIVKVNLIAMRRKAPQKSGKKLYVGIDVNSRYGVTLVAVAVEGGTAKLVFIKRFKPPNHGRRRREAAKLQRIGRGREAARVRRREKKLNKEFVKGVVHCVRELGLHWQAKGYEVHIYVDKPCEESLKNTELQGTLNGLAKALRNVALFEGFLYSEVRASGKLCPICGEEGYPLVKTNGKRIYTCGNHLWDRDFAASWNAILKKAKPKKRKAVRKLLSRLGPRALGAPPKLPPQPPK